VLIVAGRCCKGVQYAHRVKGCVQPLAVALQQQSLITILLLLLLLSLLLSVCLQLSAAQAEAEEARMMQRTMESRLTKVIQLLLLQSHRV
jgi:1,4-dihydroxy-2-naphthoate octaprenyltransferase